MRTRKAILFAAIGFVVLSAIALAAALLYEPTETIKVEGNLSAKDVAEIKAATYRYRRRAILPDFSWQSIRKLPSAIKQYREFRIDQIREYHDGTSTNVTISLAYNANGVHAVTTGGWTFFRAEKKQDHWTVHPFYLDIW